MVHGLPELRRSDARALICVEVLGRRWIADAADRLDVLTQTEAGRYYTDTTSLRAWWLYAMLEGGHPLREKLTLFWHNHFATSYAKVRSTS